MPVNREHYTKHGLHLNDLHKDLTMSNLAKLIKDVFTSNINHPPITLNWNQVSEHSASRRNCTTRGK
jgi:hypothetical protein